MPSNSTLPHAEARLIEDYLLPVARNVRGGADLELAAAALQFERSLEARLFELSGHSPEFSLAASRRDPAVTRANGS